MLQLRKVSQDEFPQQFEVSAHAVARAIERLGKRRIKTIGDVPEYLRRVALEGELYTPVVFRKNVYGPGYECNYTKTDGKVVVGVVVPLREDNTLAEYGYVTTVIPKHETDRNWGIKG